MKMRCSICHREAIISRVIGVCVDCIRNDSSRLESILESHASIRSSLKLPPTIPRSPSGIKCNICSNQCQLDRGERGFCGLRMNRDGKLIWIPGSNAGYAHTYYDPLPTNCCASWFCPGSKAHGSNLAVFHYGCNFNCLFCQNPSHKYLDIAEQISMEEFIQRALLPRVYCICYFGGDPGPHLPFCIRASRELIKLRKIRICWETNGIWNPGLTEAAAKLSLESGGILKFDLKCYHPNLSIALSGVQNNQAYSNFEMIARKYYPGSDPPLLTATTLLVPGYVDAMEVEKIAEFIASLDENIPYSLLIFHPEFHMSDLPITPRRQVMECLAAARKHLKKVNLGNLHLLGMAS